MLYILQASTRELAAFIREGLDDSTACSPRSSTLSTSFSDLSGPSSSLAPLHSLPVDGVPESCARLDARDLTLVTDVLNNCLHSFRGNEYKG